MQSVLWCFSFISIVSCAIIDSKLGRLKGSEFRAQDGSVVHSFKKVPFAQPPVGQLRYSLPQPATSWRGILDATKYGPACMTNSTTSSSVPKWVDEDCLHVNIFVSDRCLKSKSGCPIVFYVHGGGFNYDSAVMFPDDVMVENFGAKDVVLVVTAFRLGFSGLLFFSNDDVVPRNLPFYDLIQSLNWVQENIHEFGGDKKKVTLLGHSGGGAAVASLAFSKTIDPNRNLFHGMIVMSSAIQIPSNDIHLRFLTNEFIRRAGCMPYPLATTPSNNYVREMVDCLRTKDSHQLLAIQRKMEEEGMKITGFLLTEPLFPKDTQDFMRNPPRIPVMAGTTWFEMDRFPNDYAAIVADSLGYKNPSALTEKFKNDEKEHKLAFNSSSETQALFLGVRNIVRSQTVQGVKCFLYEYDNWRHAAHTDDLSYLMGVHRFEPDENEKVLAKLYPQYFINFIKTGVPDDEWEPYRTNDDNYFSIDVDVTTRRKPENALRYQGAVIDYWMKEMAAYDEKINKLHVKAVSRTAPVFIESQDDDVYSSEDPFFSWIYNTIVFGMVLLAGVLLGRMSAQRPIVIQLEDERTPLFSK